jgi:phenylalanyl-tRNA synthetase alpha chain
MDINIIQTQIADDLAGVSSSIGLEAVRVKYLGRKGVLAELTGSIGTLPAEERGIFGKQVNALKSRITELIREREIVLGGSADPAKQEELDIELPGLAQELGGSHLITQVIEQVCGIFSRMGFSIVEGPEVETEYNNFTGLNIPLDHPSRDAFDTFYLKKYPSFFYAAILPRCRCAR